MLPNKHFQQTPNEQTIVGISGRGIGAVNIRLEQSIDLALDKQQWRLGRSVSDEQRTLQLKRFVYERNKIGKPLKVSKISTYLRPSASL